MTQDQPQTKTLARDSYGGSYADPRAANAKLAALIQNSNLIAPATAVGTLPEGCEVAITIIQVDIRKGVQKNGKDTYPGGEVYDVGGGKLGLSKVVLDRIASAMAISWDSEASRRLDNGRDPYYCHYRAVGHVEMFDGSEREISAEKEMDLRDGSPQIAGKSDKQVAEQRMHILAHAESKAKLRAVRSTGIKTSYTEDELAKPFAIARSMFTGRTEDPQLRAAAFLMRAEANIRGRRALMDGSASPSQISAPAYGSRSAPPVGTVQADPDDIVSETPSARPTPKPAAAKAVNKPAPPVEGRTLSGLKCPFGKNKGVALEEIDSDGVAWWRGCLERDLGDEEKAKFHAKAKKDLAAMDAEMAYRANLGKPAQNAPPPDQGPPDDEPPPGFYDGGDQLHGQLRRSSRRLAEEGRRVPGRAGEVRAPVRDRDARRGRQECRAAQGPSGQRLPGRVGPVEGG